MTEQAHPASRPVLVELDTGSWEQFQGRVAPWLATTATLQTTFRRLADDIARSVAEPHVRDYLRDVASTAHRHEMVVEDLYPAFGLPRRKHHRRGLGAALLSTGRQAAAQLVGRAAGAHGGSWRGMRELMRSNLDTISAFGVTEQLGLALGAPPAVDLVFPVLQEKQKHQLLLKEYLLEMAAGAVLYHEDV